MGGARAFGKAIWDALGERKNPKIVFEHPGEATLPTSAFVCDTGGMVVICAGTSGYNVTLDLRYHWMMQKRFQGSHLANYEQAAAVNDLIIAKKVAPCLSATYAFDDIGHAHQLMYENKHPYGNMACLVNAVEEGGGGEVDAAAAIVTTVTIGRHRIRQPASASTPRMSPANKTSLVFILPAPSPHPCAD